MSRPCRRTWPRQARSLTGDQRLCYARRCSTRLRSPILLEGPMLMPVDARSVPRPPAAALLWVTWVAATALGGLIGEFVIWWLRSVLFPVEPPSLALPLYCLL